MQCISQLTPPPHRSEYLAAFQKTVAMHELFLQRLASHPAFREDDNLVTFLNYDKDVRD
jgi:sorting nexin-5/6/32